MRRFAILAAWLWGLAAAPGLAAENLAVGEVVDRSALRVCADPADLPFSDESQAGFENEIAELLADHLDRPLTYVWYPRTIGFIRQTLRSRLCDLVMGIVSANELVQNTNPYYRSTYVMAVREEDAEHLNRLDHPIMQTVRIGVVAGTPPANLLATYGLLSNLRPYQLQNDSRYDSPLKRMVEDLIADEIDVALGWGPPIGYWSALRGSESETPIIVSALQSPDPRNRMDYRISMGVRWGEPDWKREINDAIAELQPQITAILQRYDVPLLDDEGRLIEGTAQVSVDRDTQVASTSQSSSVDEPEGYRMERYRGKVPSTLQGGSVLDTKALQELIETSSPILVDVLPKQRQPEGQSANMPWMERKRENIPGSIWLPNTGYGELSSEFAEYFQTELEHASKGDRNAALVFYCDANCWMSYNAAKRAILEHGYRQVYWYPDGADGWKSAGLPLEISEPITMPDFVRD